MNHKIVFIILAFVAILVLGYFYLADDKSRNFEVGDSPSYVSFPSCSKVAQFVIKERNFPTNLIHSCKTSEHNAGDEMFHVVEISHGPAQDCPAGCFYDFFVGAVQRNENLIFELPGTAGDSKNYILTTVYNTLPSHDFSKIDFECTPDLDAITTMKLTKQNGQIGWEFILTNPYLCSWKEVKSTKVTMDNTFVHTADEIIRSWDGSMFVTFENGNYKWSFDNLITREVSRKEVVFEER